MNRPFSPATYGDQDYSLEMNSAILRDLRFHSIMHPNEAREHVVCEEEVGR